jgi:peptidoglycan/LPS O-acetylase OafA/YrhL
MLEHEVLARATPFRLDALLVGGLLALWMRGGQAKAMLRAVRIALPVAVALLLIFVLWKPSRFYQQPYHYPWWTFTWGLLAIDLLSVLTIAVAIQPGSLMYRVLHQRPLRWLGRISYGAYVLHDIPHLLYISVARRVFPHHLQRASVGLAFISTCILAWLSYRFFEGPFLNLKERWTVRRQYAQ